jgi:hypothetical protein
MNSSLQKFKAWRVQRKKRSEERLLRKWEQTRAEGKKRYVWRHGLAYGLTVAGVSHTYQTLFATELEPILLKAIFFVLVGLYIASDTWSKTESKYQVALHEARMRELQDRRTSP